MSSILEFSQPSRPLSINESNRLHWAARSRRLKPWALATRAAWDNLVRRKEARPGEGYPIVLQVTLTFPRAARRDAHNYTGTVVKAIVDALVSANAIPDDTPTWVTILDPIIRVAPDNLCRVSITRRTKNYEAAL